MQVMQEAETLRGLLEVKAGAVNSVGGEPRFSKRKQELEPEEQMAEGLMNTILMDHALKQRCLHSEKIP